MYPSAELSHLAAHKSACRRRIARSRHQCATAATGAARPLAWLDLLATGWRRFLPLPPLASLSLSQLRPRRDAPRAPLLGTLLRWVPAACSAWQALAARPE